MFLGSRKTLVQVVVAVESVKTFARVVAGRFFPRTICDPIRAGVAVADDSVLDGKGLSLLAGLAGRVQLGLWSWALVERRRRRSGRRLLSGCVGVVS